MQNQTYKTKPKPISHALSLRVLRKDFVIFLVKAVNAWVRSAFGSEFYSILGVGNWDRKTPSPHFRQKIQLLNCWGSNNLNNWWDFIPLWWVFRHSCGRIPTSPKISSGGTALWAFCNFVFLRLSRLSVSVKSSLGLGGIMMLTSARNKQKVFRLLQLQHCLHGSTGKLLMTNELSFYSDAKRRVQKIWKFSMATCFKGLPLPHAENSIVLGR